MEDKDKNYSDKAMRVIPTVTVTIMMITRMMMNI